MMTKDIIVFDFDGVLLDSSRELVVTAYNLTGENSARSVKDVDPKFFQKMRSLLNYARNGGETSTLAMLLHQSLDFNLTREEFNEIVASLALEGRLLQVQTDYFNARRKFINSDKEKWMALNEVNQPIWDYLCMNMQGEVTILTYKNPDAVAELCEYFGLQVGEVHAIPSGVTKAKALVKIAQEREARTVFYVDDAYKNLCEIKNEIDHLDVRYLWASWGYGYEASMAKDNCKDIQVINQDDLIEIIKTI
jgi:phosphoglycolate phosphatase-like HAD superfamily hydrolase